MKFRFGGFLALLCAVCALHVGSAIGFASGLSPVNLAAKSARAVDSWQTTPRDVELPRGNPLTDALEFSPSEAMLFADLGGGKILGHWLVDDALAACGVTDAAALDRFQAKYNLARTQLLKAVLDANIGIENVRGRIELVHRVLHQNLLGGGYSADATNLAETLNTGIYNCASGTLLFVALASEVGLDARAVELPGHVRAVVQQKYSRYVIEITCPTWPEALQSRESGVSGQESAAKNVNEREISSLGLLAMIYYNRGVDAFNDRRFAEAVAVNRRALLLDPDNHLAYGNLLAAVNNWALALSDAHHFAEAEALLAAGQKFDPAHLAFVHNAQHIRQVWTQSQSAL